MLDLKNQISQYFNIIPYDKYRRIYKHSNDILIGFTDYKVSILEPTRTLWGIKTQWTEIYTKSLGYFWGKYVLEANKINEIVNQREDIFKVADILISDYRSMVQLFASHQLEVMNPRFTRIRNLETGEFIHIHIDGDVRYLTAKSHLYDGILNLDQVHFHYNEIINVCTNVIKQAEIDQQFANSESFIK